MPTKNLEQTLMTKPSLEEGLEHGSNLRNKFSRFLYTAPLIAFLGMTPSLSGQVLPQESISNSEAKTNLSDIVVQRPDLRVEDTWDYFYTNQNKKITKTIKTIKDGVVYVAEDNECWRDLFTYTLDWGSIENCAILRGSGGIQSINAPSKQFMPFPVKEGQTWESNYRLTGYRGGVSQTIVGKANGWENITVPAGKYLALKIEATVVQLNQHWTIWYATEANNFIKAEVNEYRNDYELTGYKRAAIKPVETK